MKNIFALCFCLLLVACAGRQEPSIYDAGSYHKMSWASKSFEEMRARCRHTSLRHEKDGNYYEVRRPLYKACMEHFGYLYKGPMEVVQNDAQPPLFGSLFGRDPVTVRSDFPTGISLNEQPASNGEDKSALYR